MTDEPEVELSVKTKAEMEAGKKALAIHAERYRLRQAAEAAAEKPMVPADPADAVDVAPNPRLNRRGAKSNPAE